MCLLSDELERIVSLVAEDELRRIIELRKLNFLRSLIAFLIGFLIVILGFFSMFVLELEINYNTYWIIFFILVLGMVFSAQGVRFLNIARDLKKLGGGNYLLKISVACTNSSCDFIEERNWSPGDYVGKILDETCEKCGSKLQIVRIYGIPEKKLKSIPLLPGITQTYHGGKRSIWRRLFDLL